MLQTPTQPLVSIIIPAYNYGHLIGQTLDSLAAQTYQAWECVVVDDGSTDDTRSVVEAYAACDPRIRYVRQENLKLAAARNNGVRHSAGDYFQFLDADDLIEPRKFERQVEYLERHPHVDIVYSGVRFFSTEGEGELKHSRRYSVWEDESPWMPEVSGRGDAVLSKLLRNNIMVVNSPLLRRRVVEAVGEFGEGIFGVEDWDYWTRCAVAGMYFQYDAAEGARALVRAHEMSMSLDGRRMMRMTLKMRRRWAERVLADPGDLRLNRRFIAEGEGLLGVEEAMHGRRTRGVLQLLKAAALDRPLRHRAKWLACALLAPFLSGQELRNLTTTPLGSSAAAALRRFQLNARR